MTSILGRFGQIAAALLAGALAYVVFSRALPDISEARTLGLTVVVALFVAIGLAVIGLPGLLPLSLGGRGRKRPRG